MLRHLLSEEKHSAIDLYAFIKHMRTEDLTLKRQHLNTKVYKAYFHYIRKNHPLVDIPKLCEQAGLSYEYVSHDNNWVSVVFDNRLTKLMIESTGEPSLCYKAGGQQVTEEVMGKFLYYLMRYAVSVQLVIAQLGQITSLFSKVTKVTTTRERKGCVNLRLSLVTEGLTEEELSALKENVGNIFQNTIGHYTAIPSCQDLPAAQVAYQELRDERGLPAYDIRVSFAASWKRLETLVVLATLCGYFVAELVTSRYYPELKHPVRWLSVIALLSVSLLIMGIKYLGLRRGFNLSLNTFNRLDQRYGEVHKAKEMFERLFISYSRFVPREFLKLLGRHSVLDVRLGENVEIEMTIMFTDIRSFTSLSEKMSPRENFLFLNSYLQRISPIIRKNGGFIDKYLGDGIMAIFPRTPRDALFASVAMIRAMRMYNAHRKKSGYSPIKIGIGLNTGKAILGTIGNPEQMDGTVISDCVNVAARLEQMTKNFGCSVLVAEETLRASGLEGKILARRIGKVSVRGKTVMLNTYDVYHGDTVQTRLKNNFTKAAFERGVDLLEQGKLEEAKREFEWVLKENPLDKTARYLRDLAEEKAQESDPNLQQAG
jgi:class 3 adenylate cyclase